jgi:Cys-rich repeat protein
MNSKILCLLLATLSIAYSQLDIGLPPILLHPIDPLPTDKCLYTRCPLNQRCVDGRCVGQCSNVICPSYQFCMDGVCISSNQPVYPPTPINPIQPIAPPPVLPPCYNVNCGYKSTCVNSICVPTNQCFSNSDCPAGNYCTQGTCTYYNNCQFIKCPTLQAKCGIQAYNLAMPSNNCCDQPVIQCGPNYWCDNGRCVLQIVPI